MTDSEQSARATCPRAAGLNVREGEGFRMPAIASHSLRHGPAYENRPSTNPRGCGDGLWGLRVSLGRGDGETNSVLVSAGT
jgi:hypothetical protein